MPLLECLGTSTIKTTVTVVSNVTSTFIYTAFFVFTLVFKFPSSLNFSPIGHNLFPQPVLYFASQSLWGLWRGNTGKRNEKLCWLFHQNTGVFPLQIPGGFVYETHEWPCKCTDKLQSWFPSTLSLTRWKRQMGLCLVAKFKHSLISVSAWKDR